MSGCPHIGSATRSVRGTGIILNPMFERFFLTSSGERESIIAIEVRGDNLQLLQADKLYFQ